MEEKGKVLKHLEGDLYKVLLLNPMNQCNTCALKSHCNLDECIIIAKSSLSRKKGDEVTVNIKEKNGVFIIFIVFLIPLTLSIIGAALSFKIIFPGNTLASFFIFFLLFALSMKFLHFIDNKSINSLPIIN